ncbi:MAG TPA: choice-of-anchor tandem repeat NxxGxxAF-containing protein [Pyrinomonadaceae bacterium]|jgi:hypothetical protein|nr:choice-of-anchor tandem repeat NxxGxxAF-containing protein [Pyrinomonadaceae bacterium]
MKSIFPYLISLIVAASLALPFAEISSAAQVEVRHTIIATTGDPAPDGGNYLPGSFANVRLNASSQVTFDASVGPPFTTGVFVGDGKTTSTVALGSNPSFGAVNNPFITPNGDVVFDVNFSNPFKSDGKTIVPLAQDGDAAPGGGILIPTQHVVNDHGAIAFGAIITDSAATQGIFRTDGTESVAIARDDVSPPTGGTFTILDDLSINERGQVAFFSAMTGGKADFGVFRGDGGELTPIFVSNQPAPGDATFGDFGNPIINRHGQVASTASLTNSPRRDGIFVGDGTNVIAIALHLEAAPKGGIYGEASGRSTFANIKFNDRGEVLYDAALTGGGSPRGLFRGDGEQTTTLALVGANAPGTTGTFSSFRSFKLLNDGRVVLVAALTPGVGGVNSSNSLGIWVGTSDDNLQLLARTGDVIGGKVLTNFPSVSTPFDVNENGVVWVGSFGLARAVVLSRLLGN